MKEILFSHPVIAKVVTVIGGKDDHGGFHESALFQERKQYAQLVVNLFDQAHVAGYDRIAHTIKRKCARNAVVHHCAIYRMRIAPLAFRAYER